MSLRGTLGSEVRRVVVTGGAMLYDASKAGNFTASWFDAAYWAEQGAVVGEARGRGAVLLVSTDAVQLVLRHYRRGGLIARLIRDRYVWRGENATRPFAEWLLLHQLHRAGLPVPAPVAARYQQQGFLYRGDLITERLLDTRSLAQRLEVAPLATQTWQAIGRCIRRFHEFGACHADLNAHNILLSEADRVFLIDFDRGRLRKPGLWSDGNLVRLRRSLEKLAFGWQPDRFEEAGWYALLDGYYAEHRGAPRQRARV
jgi:3-deoxy-D-manno-octulosonic acid kinase